MSLSISAYGQSLVPPRQATGQQSRGAVWLEALAAGHARSVFGAPSVLCSEVLLSAEEATASAVVPDPQSGLLRATHGEMGLEQALALAAGVEAVVSEDANASRRRAILAIVDTPGQAYGRFEEEQCISTACAAAVEAYALARKAGHPVLSLVVGGAFSGSFLSHGLHADVILAVADNAVSMQAMSAPSIARITRRTLAEVNRIAREVLPMSYDIADAHRLAIIDELLHVSSVSPAEREIEQVREVLSKHLLAIRDGGVRRADLSNNPNRAATVRVREQMRAQWQQADQFIRTPAP